MEKDTLGDYKILKEIGRGALGTTYVAEHRFLRKSFVIKVLPAEISGDVGFIQRFESHIKAIAELSHEHIVKVHNISSAEGKYFIVSDLVTDDLGETTNLAQYLAARRDRSSEEEIASILMQVAGALDEVHKQKIDGKPLIHGSLKLNNILMGKKVDGTTQIYLSDVGLNTILGEGKALSRIYQSVAASLQAGMGPLSIEMGAFDFNLPESRDSLQIWHRSFTQNYAFLAPEQKLTIKTLAISSKIDVYAFGILGYFLLMGEMPEGAFAYPSQFFGEMTYNWDALLKSCLSSHPEDRVAEITPLMQRLCQKELEKIEETIERIKPQEVAKEAPPTCEIEKIEEDPIKQTAKVFSFDQKQVEEPKTPKVSEPSVPAATPPQKERKRDYMQEAFSSFEATQQKAHHRQDPGSSHMSSIEEKLSGKPADASFKKVSPGAMADPLQEQLAAQTAMTATLEEKKEEEKKPVLNPSELKKLEYEEDPGAIFHTEPTVARYVPMKKEVTDIQPLMTDMAMVEGGEYTRGSDTGARDERPKHKIFINSFALDVHPVTNEQFVRFLEVMGGEKDSNNNDMILLKESRIKRVGGKIIIESGYARHPVVGVSWYGAVAYAKWVGKRLPNEAEWEVAACSGSHDRIYPYGLEIERSQANFFSADTTAVMSYPSNDLGLYDMVGNVYEWCQDWYDYNFYETSVQEPDNPTGPVQGVYRVLRGGCWKSLKEDLRCSHRHRNNPGTMNRTYGFRCAADVS